MFSTKDNIPKCLKSNVVYKFICANCNVSYVGETTRHLTTRITEHLKLDKQSHIFKHINNSEDCKRKCDDYCFSVLDSASSKYHLKKSSAMQPLYVYMISICLFSFNVSGFSSVFIYLLKYLFIGSLMTNILFYKLFYHLNYLRIL